jgi:branched-chain amino acid transport system substrate-binding protein
MNIHARLAVLGAGALLVTGLAACGGGNTSSSPKNSGASTAPGGAETSPTTAGSVSSAAPATGSSVTVYMVTDGDAASGTENTPAKDGISAGVAALNAKGGLLGHRVEVKFCQNPFSVEQAVQCVQDAVKDPTAIAFLGNSTNAGEQIDPLIEKAGLPIIAGLPLTPRQEASPNEFPIHIGAQMFPAAGRLAADKGLDRISVGSILTQGTAGMEQLISSLVSGTKAKVVGTVSLPITKPDLSAEATKAANESDAIVMVTDAATMGRFASAVRQQGANLTLVTGALTAGKKAMDAAGADLNGTRVVMSMLPQETEVPGNKLFLADMKAANREGSAVDEAAVNTWLGVQILSQAAKAANSVEPAALLKALNSMSNVETYGLTAPIDFTKPTSYANGTLTRLFNTSVRYATIKDGMYQLDAGDWVNVLQGR